MLRYKKRSFAVIGLGSFGSTVATALAASGDEVLGVDLDEQQASRYSRDLSQVLILDARDEGALKEAGLSNYDVVLVAIGEDLEASIICTMNLKLIGAKCIWVKAFSKTHHRILSRIGADRVIQPEREMGLHIAETLHTPFVSDFMSLGNGFHAVNVVVDPVLEGKTLKDLRNIGGDSVQVLEAMRGSQRLSRMQEDIVLEEDDRLLILGRRDDLRRFTDMF